LQATEEIKWKNYHRCGRLAERTRKRFVANIVGLPNERHIIIKKNDQNTKSTNKIERFPKKKECLISQNRNPNNKIFTEFKKPQPAKKKSLTSFKSIKIKDFPGTKPIL
jgi:hypothetical protein